MTVDGACSRLFTINDCYIYIYNNWNPRREIWAKRCDKVLYMSSVKSSRYIWKYEKCVIIIISSIVH